MADNNSTDKKGIGSIGQPADPALPGIELLRYPMKRHGRAAVVTFKNGSSLMFRFDLEDNIHQETYFSDGRNCESFEVSTEKTPSEHLNQVIADYSTISKEDLRISRPGLWLVLGVE